jgi:hypothetical protein
MYNINWKRNNQELGQSLSQSKNKRLDYGQARVGMWTGKKVIILTKVRFS